MPDSAPAADGPTTEAETALNEYLQRYSSSGYRGLSYLPRHPRAARSAFRGAQSLRRIVVDPTDTVEGRAVLRELSRGRVRLRTPLHAVSAAISVPGRGEDYRAGSSMQTLRRKLRDADRRGLSWEPVHDAATKRELVALADEHERTNPLSEYRAEAPDNRDLADYDLWLVARNRDGAPIMLSVTPVDRGIGALRYFRTLEASDDASTARYFLTDALVGELIRRDVHDLVDTMPSMHLPQGLRHFQRMVGFRLVRLEFDQR